jgi:hypothetical protein
MIQKGSFENDFGFNDGFIDPLYSQTLGWELTTNEWRSRHLDITGTAISTTFPLGLMTVSASEQSFVLCWRPPWPSSYP